MHHHDLPERWLLRLQQYTDEMYGSDYRWRGQLGVRDFFHNKSVRLTFADGSMALFHYAFTLWLHERREMMVFTEHCGYHLFSSMDITVEVLDAPPEMDGSET